MDQILSKEYTSGRLIFREIKGTRADIIIHPRTLPASLAKRIGDQYVLIPSATVARRLNNPLNLPTTQ